MDSILGYQALFMPTATHDGLLPRYASVLNAVTVIRRGKRITTLGRQLGKLSWKMLIQELAHVLARLFSR